MTNRCCDICEEEIMISSSDFPELCIVCGKEFLEIVRAMGELTIEMAKAYDVDISSQGFTLPGLPVEEIMIRKDLNRIRQAYPA
jgi:hypothetical protein